MGSDVPILQNEVPLDVRRQQGVLIDEAARKLFESTDPAVVQIDTNVGRGSGFFVDGSGDVVTDGHVVLGSDWQDVVLSSGKHLHAKVTKIDDVHDLAVLHVDGLEPGSQPFLQLGSSRNMQSGEKVYALGHPLGLTKDYLSPGRINGISTEAQWLGADVDLLDTKGLIPEEVDARLNRLIVNATNRVEHGNSGGPLVDTQGRVVGVADYLNPQGNAAEQNVFTTVEDVRSLLDSTTPKFNITYSLGPSRQGRAVINMWHEEPGALVTAGAISLAVPIGIVGLASKSFNKALANVSNAALTGDAAASPSVLARAGRGIKAGGFALATGLFFALQGDRDLHDLAHASTTSDRVESGIALVPDTVGLAGSIARFIPSMTRLGKLGIQAGILGFVTDKLLINPAIEDARQFANQDSVTGAAGYGLALAFDGIGLAGAYALATAKGNPRLAALEMAVGIGGRFLPELLPINKNMNVDRIDGDPHPPLQM